MTRAEAIVVWSILAQAREAERLAGLTDEEYEREVAFNEERAARGHREFYKRTVKAETGGA